MVTMRVVQQENSFGVEVPVDRLESSPFKAGSEGCEEPIIVLH